MLYLSCKVYLIEMRIVMVAMGFYNWIDLNTNFQLAVACEGGSSLVFT